MGSQVGYSSTARRLITMGSRGWNLDWVGGDKNAWLPRNSGICFSVLATKPDIPFGVKFCYPTVPTTIDANFGSTQSRGVQMGLKPDFFPLIVNKTLLVQKNIGNALLEI